MTLRTKRETITFAHPFTLPGVDRTQAAGAYAVETDEEVIEGLSFVAWRRIATVIFLPLPGSAASMEAVPIDPRDVEVALARDQVANDG